MQFGSKKPTDLCKTSTKYGEKRAETPCKKKKKGVPIDCARARTVVPDLNREYQKKGETNKTKSLKGTDANGGFD